VDGIIERSERPRLLDVMKGRCTRTSTRPPITNVTKRTSGSIGSAPIRCASAVDTSSMKRGRSANRAATSVGEVVARWSAIYARIIGSIDTGVKVPRRGVKTMLAKRDKRSRVPGVQD